MALVPLSLGSGPRALDLQIQGRLFVTCCLRLWCSLEGLVDRNCWRTLDGFAFE